MKKSFKVSYGGLITALGLVTMLLTALFPMADYALPAIAGVFIAAVVIELGTKWAFAVYAATAVLSVLLVPLKQSAALYVLFFGYYAIVKALAENFKSKIGEWVVKYAVFNAAMAALVFSMVFILGAQQVLSEINKFGWIGLLGLWVAANAVFLVYDIAFSRLITYYCNILRPKIMKRIK